MLCGLKNKFASLPNSDPLKLRILTIVPENWSVRKIAKEFNTSRNTVKKAKELFSLKGVLAEVTAKSRIRIPPFVISKIYEFYEDDSIIRIMPGTRDCISAKYGNQRLKEQKRLLLFGLKELYVLFKKSNIADIGFSTFAKLRPKYCILAGASGTHSVCVCTIHQNCKLMLDSIIELTIHLKTSIRNYKDCLNLLMCVKPTINCQLNEYEKCQDSTEFSNMLFKIFNGACIQDVEYSFWTASDRSTLLTQTVNVSDFIPEFCTKFLILKAHSFITKQQSEFISKKKMNLCETEVIVLFDFSENYSYVVQDASQAFHFNNNQCTVFPAIYYYKEYSELCHKSCIFLSNSLKHDTAAVYSVQQQLISEIKANVRKVKKIIYMTDGAKQHFKNRFQIANLMNHKIDFGLEAEWHFSTTAHGKSGYDGVGAIFKREAYRNSLLAHPSNAILTSEVLFKWAKTHFKNIKIFYFSKVEHDKMIKKLNKRFQTASPIPNILKNHAFIVLPNNILYIKRFSNSLEGTKILLKSEK